MLLPKVDLLISYLATDEECEISFRREELKVDAREGGGDFGGGINVFIDWNSSVTGNPDK